jgi:hypothetical protein
VHWTAHIFRLWSLPVVAAKCGLGQKLLAIPVQITDLRHHNISLATDFREEQQGAQFWYERTLKLIFRQPRHPAAPLPAVMRAAAETSVRDGRLLPPASTHEVAHNQFPEVVSSRCDDRAALLKVVDPTFMLFWHLEVGNHLI